MDRDCFMLEDMSGTANNVFDGMSDFNVIRAKTKTETAK